MSWYGPRKGAKERLPYGWTWQRNGCIQNYGKPWRYKPWRHSTELLAPSWKGHKVYFECFLVAVNWMLFGFYYNDELVIWSRMLDILWKCRLCICKWFYNCVLEIWVVSWFSMGNVYVHDKLELNAFIFAPIMLFDWYCFMFCVFQFSRWFN